MNKLNAIGKDGSRLDDQNHEGRRIESPLHAFVFLAHGFGARSWTERWSNGQVPGLNERLPYGYFHAADKHCIVDYSEDVDETRLTRFVRLSLRRLLGCDLMHAWRNRKALFAADVVWTHTELEYLAVLALWQARRRSQRPRLIAQSVWLFDKWHRLSTLRRWFYMYLMRQADILTVQSPENFKIVRDLFPELRCELVTFGINSDAIAQPARQRVHRPMRLVALGNDLHRDWETLIAAAQRWPGCRLRIASRKINPRLTENVRNVEIIALTSASEVAELYRWADLAVVPLKPNLHVSGITVICEAVLKGLPVVCSDTGGIRGYFSDDDVHYVPPLDAVALSRVLEELAANDQKRFAMARHAQATLFSRNLTSRSYALRHYEISRQLLEDRGPRPTTARRDTPA